MSAQSWKLTLDDTLLEGHEAEEAVGDIICDMVDFGNIMSLVDLDSLLSQVENVPNPQESVLDVSADDLAALVRASIAYKTAVNHVLAKMPLASAEIDE